MENSILIKNWLAIALQQPIENESEKFYYDKSKKEFFSTLWNSYRYFVTYANLFNFTYDSGVVSELLKNE